MKKWTYFFTFIAAVLLASQISFSCTSFVLDANKTLLFGSNYDNDIWPGLLYVNKKNVKKMGWEPGTTGDIAEWVSKYGSVTINSAGYQLAWAGMNEKGLVMSTMALGETKNPNPDERPPLASPLWMQYILDTCATVDELIATDKMVRIKDTVDHYLVCDVSGDAAVIEFLDGKMVVHRQKTLPIKALANRVYSECVSELKEGNPKNINGSKSRMARVDEKLLDFNPNGKIPPVAYVFEILEEVSSPPYTRWSLVFDIQNRIIHFKTYANRNARRIDLKKIDYGCEAAAMMMDVHADLKGDITDAFKEIDPEYSLNHFIRFLKESEIEMPEEQVKMLFNLFVNFPCTSEKK
jgi:penicillin V acylase-like amidase (Ntn superfamily)